MKNKNVRGTLKIPEMSFNWEFFKEATRVDFVSSQGERRP